MAKDINIGGRLHSTATGNVVAGADEILDDVKGKKQSVINAETDAAIQAETERAITAENNRYTKAETYSKQEVNSLITTPNQEYVTVEDYASLPESGEADTIYRVANWDGSLATPAADITKYSEYAWDGTGYVFLSVKSQIGEVFDISEYHSGATYADLTAALGTNGANIPDALRKGGMSVKFVLSSDNKYVQCRLMLSTFTAAQFTNTANWQGVDDEPTAGSDNLVKSGGAFAKVIKLTGMGSNTGQYHVTKVGDCFYHTTNKKIYRCTIFPITIFVDCVAEVPFVEGAVYIYNNGLYMWNGSDLVPTEDEKAFNGIVTTQDLDTLFDSGTYKYATGAIVIVTNYSNNDIRQIRIFALSTGTMNIGYRKYNGTSWSDWEVFLDGQTYTKAIEAYQKTIELKCFATSLGNASTKGATVGDYFFNTTINKIVLIIESTRTEVIPFIKGAVYTYGTSLYKWDFDNETLIPIKKQTIVYYVDVPLSQCDILPKAVDGSNNWIMGTLFIIPVKSSAKIKFKANATNNNTILFLKYIPDTSESFDTNSYAGTYTGRVALPANTEAEYDIPEDCNYICVNRTTSAGTSNRPQYAKIDVDGLYFDTSQIVGDIYKQGLKENVNGAIVIKNPDYTPINDTFSQYAASDCRWLIDSISGMAYAIYMCGKINYYETTGRIGATMFHIAQPWRQEYFDIAKTGDLDEHGASVGTTFIGNLCRIDTDTIRFFFCNVSGQYYYYRDLDVPTKTLGAIKRVQFNNADLTRDALRAQIIAAGYAVPAATSISVRGRLNGDIIDGYRYALFDVYEGIGYQAIMKSNDNWASLEFVGVVPYQIQYEAGMTKNGSTWYIIYRTEAGQMLTTTDDFTTYTEPVQINDLSAKPDLFSYNGQVYIVSGYSDGPDGTFKRSNLQLLRGTGTDLTAYTKVLEIFDKKGVVYPMVHQFAKAQYFMMCYGTSPVSLDEENGSINQRYRGKECVVFKKVRMV